MNSESKLEIRSRLFVHQQILAFLLAKELNHSGLDSTAIREHFINDFVSVVSETRSSLTDPDQLSLGHFEDKVRSEYDSLFGLVDGFLNAMPDKEQTRRS
jgi:hypothetical protein